jgi:hypothetical protein
LRNVDHGDRLSSSFNGQPLRGSSLTGSPKVRRHQIADAALLLGVLLRVSRSVCSVVDLVRDYNESVNLSSFQLFA